MLMTSRKHINKLAYIQECPYVLYALSFESSLKLLIQKAPWQITESEIRDLLKTKIPNNHKLKRLYPIEDDKNMSLVNHPFTKILGGHP